MLKSKEKSFSIFLGVDAKKMQFWFKNYDKKKKVGKGN